MKIKHTASDVRSLPNSNNKSNADLLVTLKTDNSSTEALENQLKCLNLNHNGDDNKGKLIERAPIRKKDDKAKTKPYEQVQVVGQYVSHTHNCGGILIQTKEVQQVPHNITCAEFPNCDTCILQIGNSPEFKDFVYVNLSHNENIQSQKGCQKENNILCNNGANVIFSKSSQRRISNDSGFQSDSPSPKSESVLSPHSDLVLSPKSKPEAVPIKSDKKTIETRKMNADATTKTASEDANHQTEEKIQNSRQQSPKELLRAALDLEVKLKKWVDVMVNKTDTEVFGINKNGKTILHEVLNNDKYIMESFYPLVEKMKRFPQKCVHIVETQSSICDEIKQKHLSLLLDYFQEAIRDIQDNFKNGKLNN